MNRKSTEARAQILNLLVEGNSLRSTSRITGASLNTVTKLLGEAGEAALEHQDRAMRDLTCKRLQIDEIWSFVAAKDRNVPQEKRGEFGIGSVWTFTAVDADTKIVPAFFVGGRNACDASTFLTDLRERLAGRVQITTDGHKMYLAAMDSAFGADADFAMLQKHYAGLNSGNPEARYSPGVCCGATKEKIEGNPDTRHISTSFVERQNLTIRMTNRRFTRLTNAFSKKIENHIYMLALHFLHYNFCKVHKTLRTSPAMAAGVDQELRDVEWIVSLIDARQPEPGKRGPYKPRISK